MVRAILFTGKFSLLPPTYPVHTIVRVFFFILSCQPVLSLIETSLEVLNLLNRSSQSRAEKSEPRRVSREELSRDARAERGYARAYKRLRLGETCQEGRRGREVDPLAASLGLNAHWVGFEDSLLDRTLFDLSQGRALFIILPSLASPHFRGLLVPFG